MCGALLLWPLEQLAGLENSLNSSGGSLILNVQIAGLAAICWAIWKLRNRSCFEKKLIKSPNELISLSAFFMNYLAGLHKSPDEENLKAGANNLLWLVAAATATPSATGGRSGRRTLTITDDVTVDPDGEDMETDDT
jgi:hypothetical protein